MRLTALFNDFFASEKAGGLVLLLVTIGSLSLANSGIGEGYIHFWHLTIAGSSLTHWINDGLMTIFFLLIGLELEREIYRGELSDIKNASLPILAAFGGMVVPAAIYLSLNYGKDSQAGAGIPMATDIAFAIGILSLLGNRVPPALKVFLTALAVIDDLGAILIIAIFYTGSLSFVNLFISLAFFGLLLVLNRMKVQSLLPYLMGGLAMWYFMALSGVHATITGVLLAFTIPFGDSGTQSPSRKLQHFLHKPVAFAILPLFAAANTCIAISNSWSAALTKPLSLGIFAGLVIGKPLGIWLFSFIGVSLGWCSLPGGIKWKNILGAGCLGGIGFTMSIFITLLAFDHPESIANAKIAIIIGSAVSGIIGFIFLKSSLKKG